MHVSRWSRHNAEVLADFVSVFGHAQILSETGKHIWTWLPLAED